MTTETKTCKACGETKPLTEFYRKLNGHQPKCKDCVKAYQAARRKQQPEHMKAIDRRSRRKHKARRNQESRAYRAQRKDRLNREQRKRYHTDPEYRQRMIDLAVSWGKRNPERKLEIGRRWKERNPEKAKAVARAARLRSVRKRPNYHRRLWVIYAANQRARDRGVPGELTLEEWEQIKSKYNHTCLGCGRKEPDIKLTIDHVVPTSRGGVNNASNVQPLCLSCNSRKSDKIIDYRQGKRGQRHDASS